MGNRHLGTARALVAAGACGVLFLLAAPASAGQKAPAAASAPSTQPTTFLHQAQEVSRYIQKAFWIQRTGLYRRSVGDDAPDFMWGNGVMFSALVAACRHEPRTYRPVLARFFAAMDRYWDTRARIPGYEPAPTRGGGHDKYYDDNAWLVMAFLEAYEATADRRFLDRAEQTLKFVLSGWDDQLGGGIWWHEQHKDGTKNTCANAPAAVGCLRLAKFRRADVYVPWARKIVAWTRQHLQDADGLFWDRQVVATGEVKKGKLTYNSALMIRALLGLWRHTGEDEFLAEARRVGKAGDWFVGKATGAYRDDVKWSHLMVEADLELFRATKEQYLLDRARKNAEYHYARWKASPPKEMMPNASVARMLWLMADAETPTGQAFWQRADRVRK